MPGIYLKSAYIDCWKLYYQDEGCLPHSISCMVQAIIKYSKGRERLEGADELFTEKDIANMMEKVRGLAGGMADCRCG